MKKLIWEDFKKMTDCDNSYFVYDFGAFGICLEPCLSGFDVGTYRKSRMLDGIMGLVEDKKCTNLNFERDNDLDTGLEGLKKGQQNMVKAKALKYANEFYNKYNK